jgi:hypothetical protein
VTEQHDRDGVVFTRGRRQRAEGLHHVVARRLLVGEQRDVVLRHAQLVGRRRRQRRPPLLEQLAVLRIAREPDDDQHMCLLRVRGHRRDQAQRQRRRAGPDLAHRSGEAAKVGHASLQ